MSVQEDNKTYSRWHPGYTLMISVLIIIILGLLVLNKFYS